MQAVAGSCDQFESRAEAPSRKRRLFRLLILSVLIVANVGLGMTLLVGTLASAPIVVPIGLPPSDLPVEAVTIDSTSGSPLSGWYIAGQARVGAVLLMHGVRANRLEMVERARLLHREGLSVLLFDFQAHLESAGRNITFGYLESRDARAAFDYLRRKTPDEHVGVIGVSLGGAAAILASLDADAMVLEAVYASFDKAVENRLTMRVGMMGRLLAPMLTWQVKWRLGFDPRLLQPAARIAQLHTPLLLIAGDEDKHATLDEMKLLYARANEPKELWIIPGARHIDFCRYARKEYQRRVLDFLMPRLRSSRSEGEGEAIANEH